MSYETGNSGAWRNDGGVQPHAYDPYLHPELFRGVATRRAFAFLIDLVIISVPVILGYVFIFVFGVVTLGVGFLRFDYSGHGQSSGHYTEGTISRWLEESLAVIDRFAKGRLVLVGSSMGGWVTLRIIEQLRKRGEQARIGGIVLIAPAPDFTSVLIEPHLTEKELKSLAENGYFEEESAYSPEPNRYSRALIEDGRHNLVMNGLIETGCPVHILQGMKDPGVPYSHALAIMEKIVGDDAILTLVRDGDHRLSRPEDIERIEAALAAMLANV